MIRTVLVVVLSLAAAVAVVAGGVETAALVTALLVGAVLLGAMSRGLDAVGVLSIYVVALFVVPAGQVVPSLKAAGAPSLLMGLGMGAWWIATRISRNLGGDRGRQPVRPVLVGYMAVVMCCFGMAFTGPLSGVQVSSAHRAVLSAFALIGVALVTADGVASLHRLHDLIRRVVLGAGYVAFVAILQFENLFDPAGVLVPGLVRNNENLIQDRAGFARVIGTTAHPIEAGVVLGVAFPLALHLLVSSPTRRDRRIGGVVTALIAVAIFMTVSRTAPLVLGVGVVILILSWEGARRRRALVVGAIGIVAIRLAFPGLLGTVRSLFEYAGEDPSVTGRTDDYSAIFQLFDDNPVFGIGPGTFLPESYFYLDNQFLGTAVEMGTLGLLALVVVFLTGVGVGVATRRRTTDPRLRDMAQALVASLVAGFVSFATFDALGFAMFAGMWFLLLGMLGAAWRLVARGPLIEPVDGRTHGAEVPA